MPPLLPRSVCIALWFVLLMAQPLSFGIEIRGKVTTASDRSSTAARRPFADGTVRLCSTEHILETKTDRNGVFRFESVSPGRYELIAGGGEWRPRLLSSLEIGNEPTAPLEASLIEFEPSPTQACFHYEAQDCQPTRFYIDYDPPAAPRRSAFLAGVVTFQYKKEKPIRGATINLFKSGEV